MDQMHYDATFKLPFSLVALGPRGSGKSFFFKELLLSPLLDPLPERIVFVCDTFDDEIVAPLKQKYADKIGIVALWIVFCQGAFFCQETCPLILFSQRLLNFYPALFGNF